MYSEHNSYSRRLGRWLERFGFFDDPFALYEADQEKSFLHEFFVDRPYLHDILGEPTRPQAAFLMAGRGDGKTATREMVAYGCAHAQLRRRALAVRYYDFSPLLEQVNGDLAQITARHHVRIIVRYMLRALAEDVPPTYFDLLGEMERALLKGYLVAFGVPNSRLKLNQILPEEPVNIDWDALSPLEILKTLADLVTQLGQSPESRYQALYILVDRVDETSADPKASVKAAVSLLSPLVSEGPLLQMNHVAFKFFLPIRVGQALQQVVELRPDRLCVRTITWDETSLRQMIQQRLSYYSAGRVERLEDLCTPGAKTNAMKRLIEVCEGSPRTLLRLCGALIHRHVTHSSETQTLINHTELIDTVRDFKHRLEVERTPPSTTEPEEITSSTMDTSPPEIGLYLDTNGHVWVDGEPLSPPLSQLEYRLLEVLYRQAPEIVPHEALIEAVWPSSAWMSNEGVQGRDEQNLRKLVDRLRKRLPEPSSRFIKNVRGRGYWLQTNNSASK